MAVDRIYVAEIIKCTPGTNSAANGLSVDFSIVVFEDIDKLDSTLHKFSELKTIKHK